MTLLLDVAGANAANAVTLSGAPAVRITANNVRFTNTERGRLNATDAGAALVITGAGTTVINETDGAILAQSFNSAAVAGSAFADRIENRGSIFGSVALGGGRDVFIHQSVAALPKLALDGGDDRLEIVGTQYQTYYSADLDGGAGDDTLLLGGTIGQFAVSSVRNFEHLVIGPYAQNIDGLSGFKTITVITDNDPQTYDVAGLSNARNPDVALVLDGGDFGLRGDSSLGSVTGGSGNDSFELGSYSAVSRPQIFGAVDLAGGDDHFRLSIGNDALAPLVTVVNGGAGIDSISFLATGGQDFDASPYVGFEYFYGGTWTSATSQARIRGLNGYLGVEGDSDTSVISFADSNSPDAAINTSSGGTIIIEASSVFGRVGFASRYSSNADYSQDQASNPLGGISVINNGRILGGVALFTGDDLYDGRLGSTGGPITASAGNDTIYAGSAAAWVDAGYGADDVYGNAGNDTLIGNGGGDIIDGGAGSDLMFGGIGNDRFLADSAGDLVFEAAGEGSDTVAAAVGFYLYANIEALELTGDADFGVGNGLANVITGNTGSNLLIGLDGNDTIDGGGGIDALFGGLGDDALNGDAGIDYLVGGIGNDSLDVGAAADALYGEAGDDSLSGGASFDTDILVGGDGNDSLDGASGLGDYDRLDGAAGNDVYRVDTPDDLTFEAAGGGIDTVYADIDGAGYYLYAFTENLVLAGNTPFGVGNELANQLTGNGQGNYLLGGLGNDTIDGGAGNDVLFGEGGADIFVFEQGGGGDVIGDFQAGTDRIDVRYVFSGFAAVEANLSQVGNTSALNLGNGDFIVLNGVANASLSAGDFIFG